MALPKFLRSQGSTPDDLRRRLVQMQAKKLRGAPSFGNVVGGRGLGRITGAPGGFDLPPAMEQWVGMDMFQDGQLPPGFEFLQGMDGADSPTRLDADSGMMQILVKTLLQGKTPFQQPPTFLPRATRGF